jgi:hypothetical protein
VIKKSAYKEAMKPGFPELEKLLKSIKLHAHDQLNMGDRFKFEDDFPMLLPITAWARWLIFVDMAETER